MRSDKSLKLKSGARRDSPGRDFAQHRGLEPNYYGSIMENIDSTILKGLIVQIPISTPIIIWIPIKSQLSNYCWDIMDSTPVSFRLHGVDVLEYTEYWDRFSTFQNSTLSVDLDSNRIEREPVGPNQVLVDRQGRMHLQSEHRKLSRKRKSITHQDQKAERYY